MTKEHFTLSGHQTNDGGQLGPGNRLGHYVLLMPLGAGAMGQVWKARDEAGDRDVAIKMLPPTLRGNDDAINQVRKSFQQVHALTHQHIGKMLGMYDDATYGPYIVMDLVPGVPLSTLAEKRREAGHPLKVDEIIKFLKSVAEALDYAHTRGVLHRDVKPQNVLVQYEPMFEITLIDFGLAAAIRSTVSRFTQGAGIDSRGTRPYMSPEQIQGKRQLWDGRTDLYSLAVMAYELLSGHLPFDSDDDFALMYAITNTPADPVPGLPDAVNKVLLKGLSKQREDRFASCLEFVTSLQTAFVPVQAPPEPTRPNFKSLNQPKVDPKPVVPVEVLEIVPDREAEEAKAWSVALLAGTREAFESFIRKWPRGQFATEAQKHIQKLTSTTRPAQKPPEQQPTPNRQQQRQPVGPAANRTQQRAAMREEPETSQKPRRKSGKPSTSMILVIIGGIVGSGFLFLLVVGVAAWMAANDATEFQEAPQDPWSVTAPEATNPWVAEPPVTDYTTPANNYQPWPQENTTKEEVYEPWPVENPAPNRLNPGGY